MEACVKRRASSALLAAWVALGCVACGGEGTAPSADGGALAADGGPPGDGGLRPPPLTTFETSRELVIAGDRGSTLGIFDPSLVYPAGASAGALSYSSVAAQNAIGTRIAVSADRGANWTFVAAANAPGPLTIDCGAARCAGQLIHEVSSLVYDAGDPITARHWKLFTHSYLVEGASTLHYEYGQISLFTAARPEGPWSERTGVLGWRTDSPFSSAGAATLVGDVAGINDCLFLSEPAAVVRGEAILDLAVGCIYIAAGVPRIRVELLRSLDHAATFSRVGRLLSPDDAAALDPSFARFNAASLFSVGAKQFLLASPEGPNGYRGCIVVEVVDPGRGVLARSETGALVLQRRMDTPEPRFNGACAYAEGASAIGYLGSVGFFDDPRPFRIVSTGVLAP